MVWRQSPDSKLSWQVYLHRFSSSCLRLIRKDTGRNFISEQTEEGKKWIQCYITSARLFAGRLQNSRGYRLLLNALAALLLGPTVPWHWFLTPYHNSWVVGGKRPAAHTYISGLHNGQTSEGVPTSMNTALCQDVRGRKRNREGRAVWADLQRGTIQL